MAATPSHVLVVLDPASKQQPALERAAWLAERTDASLELFVCDYEQDFATSKLFDAGALERARRHLLATHTRTLKDHARRLANRGIRTSVDASWDRPLDAAIVRKAADSKADIVLKDARYHPELGRALFSSADWNLMLSCPAQLWLVKPRPIAERATILAAVDPRSGDGESIDDRILSAATTLSTALDGELQVFHGFDVASALAISANALTAPISAPVRDLAAALQRKHDEAVFALTDRHLLDRGCVHVHEGPVGQLLLAMTQEIRVDLLVMGAVSRSGLPHPYIGSTAEHVLEMLPCDLLIVRPV